jgi:uridine phosphorylase
LDYIIIQPKSSAGIVDFHNSQIGFSPMRGAADSTILKPGIPVGFEHQGDIRRAQVDLEQRSGTDREDLGMTWLITPEQTLSAARWAGLGDRELELSGVAVLTFSMAVIDRLEALCALRDARWLAQQHHPYATARIFKRGTHDGIGITALVPPMGSSPLACIVEDLVACGIRAVFLVCAAWSLGPPVQFGDLVIPSVSLGPDGTSIHYSNERGEADAEPAAVNALATSCRERGVPHHVGGNATCEALYRITPEMAERFRHRGCLCMDNGEASTLFAVARTLGVLGGVLFQPYIELAKGWHPALLRDKRYVKTCHLQAEVVLAASTRLDCGGLIV